MSVFTSPGHDQHELVAFHEDKTSGLKAIIAIHDSTLGPAMGGCRMYPYHSDDDALQDVLRLSRGMTYKSALAGLPLGGGKAVIIGDHRVAKTRNMLLAMAEFVDSLGGRYITAEDSGTSVADMKVMKERTQYVSGVTSQQRFGGDPSPYTAYGVYCGILAALRFQRGSDALNGLRFSVQGAGAVGRHLIERLVRMGAEVIVADIDQDNLKRAEKLGARVVSPESIVSVRADVFVPCAMGGVLTDASVSQLRADIVAGAANNQLASPEQADYLRQRGVLYAPDFVINAGGIIDVFYQQDGKSGELSEQRVEAIADTLTEVFNAAQAQGISTHQAAEEKVDAMLSRRRMDLKETA